MIMDEAEFDIFADEYRSLHASNIAISGESPEFFAEYKIKDIATEYSALHSPGAPLRMLDFGAGVGASVPFIRQHLPDARLTCLDVSAKSLEVGRSRFPGQAEFVRFDGTRIPMPDGSFDIVFAACVFHHIAPDEHVALLREFFRVLAAGGMACVFEHNPFNPLTVRAVDTCPFDENARLIRAKLMKRRFADAGFTGRTRYRIFFPGMLGFLRPLERFMTWLPLGAQYYVVASK
jgi:ubiquinone/menaquinone biosynthesis C-methylase UbiE